MERGGIEWRQKSVEPWHERGWLHELRHDRSLHQTRRCEVARSRLGGGIAANVAREETRRGLTDRRLEGGIERARVAEPVVHRPRGVRVHRRRDRWPHAPA